jgi:hypothetical protein
MDQLQTQLASEIQRRDRENWGAATAASAESAPTPRTADKASNGSFWTRGRRWIAGILGTVLAGVIAGVIVNLIHDHTTGKGTQRPESPPAVSTTQSTSPSAGTTTPQTATTMPPRGQTH